MPSLEIALKSIKFIPRIQYGENLEYDEIFSFILYWSNKKIPFDVFGYQVKNSHGKSWTPKCKNYFSLSLRIISSLLSTRLSDIQMFNRDKKISTGKSRFTLNIYIFSDCATDFVEILWEFITHVSRLFEMITDDLNAPFVTAGSLLCFPSTSFTSSVAENSYEKQYVLFSLWIFSFSHCLNILLS